jgi:ElaB/YqjD/DUF883 family membrane-anchored ribosome-binding protein
MDFTHASKQWVHLAEALAARWEELTVADLAQIQARVSQLADVVQQRYRLTIDEARQQVAEFEHTLRDEAKMAYAALVVKADNIRRHTRNLRHDISEFGWMITAERLVARYPGYAVGLAAALGLVIGGAIGASTRRARRW